MERWNDLLGGFLEGAIERAHDAGFTAVRVSFTGHQPTRLNMKNQPMVSPDEKPWSIEGEFVAFDKRNRVVILKACGRGADLSAAEKALPTDRKFTLIANDAREKK